MKDTSFNSTIIEIELSNKMWEAQFTCERERNDSKNCYDFLSHMWLECKCFCSGKGSRGGGSSYRGTKLSPEVILFPTGRARGILEAAMLGECRYERGSTVRKVGTVTLVEGLPHLEGKCAIPMPVTLVAWIPQVTSEVLLSL